MTLAGWQRLGQRIRDLLRDDQREQRPVPWHDTRDPPAPGEERLERVVHKRSPPTGRAG